MTTKSDAIRKAHPDARDLPMPTPKATPEEFLGRPRDVADELVKKMKDL